MEVHAHSHTARKKWTHYLWEFLMLFLAVFCGFLAENLREHQVERHREKEYMRTLIADLKSDTLQISMNVPYFEETLRGLDTLMQGLKANDAIENPDRINACFGYAKNDIQFVQANRTINQLKSSGNMRLIRKQDVSDSILFYDQVMQLVTTRYETQKTARNNVLELLDEVVDENTTEHSTTINRTLIPIANPKKLITKEKYKLDILFNKIKRLKGQQQDYLNSLEILKTYGGQLIALLEKKYH